MTLIIEYRLPALGADLAPLTTYPDNLLQGAASLPAWREQMARWGSLWRELSNWNPASTDPAEVAAFQSHLQRIVRIFAAPENFTALRANIGLRREGAQPEFELREWYMVRGNQWSLIPRKPRDEPYRCMAEGGDLAALIGHFWDPARGDLRMDRVNEASALGYTVPRAVNNAPALGGYTLADPPRGCRLGGGQRPFEMAPNDGGTASRITAPFGRIREGFVWEIKNAGGADIPEAQRHQFAMRTCTGCHSREAGLFGFHISPRLPGRQAELSSFLTGEPSATFSHGGATYRYAELADRAAYLERAADADPALMPFEALYRDDVAR